MDNKHKNKQRMTTTIRLPEDVKNFIETQAKENACSQTSEVVRAIRAAMKEKGVTEAATSSRHVQESQAKDKKNELND